jgi:FAD:protein FMN transferase
MHWYKSKLTQNHKLMSKQFTFEAIGTHWWIEIFDEISDEELDTTKRRIEFLCSEFNKKYSRFLPDSQISLLNHNRVLNNPSEECRAMLTYGKALYLRTHTAFNILTGHILEARGYDMNYSFTAQDNLELLPVCNPITDLTISESSITLSCGNLDNGGYGKGWLIDLIKEDLLAHGSTYFLINGGGDMYATSEHEEPITVYLEHPTEAGKYISETTLLNQGFAASSPFKRQWSDQGVTYTHIVSDKEVLPLGAFTKAATATDADAFATACGLLGEAELLSLSEYETVSFARFNPTTNELWQTANFT